MKINRISLALMLAGASSGALMSACVRRVYVTPRAYEPVYVSQPAVVVQQPPAEVEPQQPVYVGQAPQQEIQPPPPEVQPVLAEPPPPMQASVVVAAPPPAAQPVVYVQEQPREGWVPPHRRHGRHVIVVH